jgi:hypothetical protein
MNRRSAGVVLLTMAACVRHPVQREPSATTSIASAEPTDEPDEPPLVAEFPAPTLSAETRAAWNALTDERCDRFTWQPPPEADCTPLGHAAPCRTRDFEAELERCDGSFACLELAREVLACERCDHEIDDAVVEKRIAEVSADCGGLLRFFDPLADHEDEQLMFMARTPQAIECLAKSKEPGARPLLAHWTSSRKDDAASTVLLTDPEPTRAWLRTAFSGMSKGRSMRVDRWDVWNVFDLLGSHADPLLPEVRAVAVSGDREHRRYDHDAIRRLGMRQDRDAVPLLRRILDAHTDWRAQESAAQSLGEIGVDAIAAASELDSLARDHWSTYVRDAATWAAARVRGEGPATRPAPTQEWPHDTQCPIDSMSLHGVFGGGTMWHHRWPWMTKIGDQTITLPHPRRTSPVLPKAVAEVDLVTRFPDIARTHGPLTKYATVVRPHRGGWLVGTDHGEWGGALWWFDRRGRVRHLVTANIFDVVELAGHLYALTGAGRMHTGSLLRIDTTRRAYRVRHALELPGDPRAWWVRGEELWLGTFEGLFVIDTDLRIRAQPCHTDETFPGTLDDEQIAAGLARVRPIVDRCLEALPPADLPCGDTLHPIVDLQFRVDASGSVTAAEPLESFSDVRFPEVEACIAARALDWRFAAPKGGAAIFGYAFSNAR